MRAAWPPDEDRLLTATAKLTLGVQSLQRAGLAGQGPVVAVLIPCHDEAPTIAKVVADFRAALPQASIYVYDNNSTDGTCAAAAQAGAVVRRAALQGKGNVVRRMFSDVTADVYVLVDGDDTYDAPAAPRMVARLIEEDLDMVCGVRVSSEVLAYRSGHRLGNRMLTGLVRRIFGQQFTDMLSGYRVFSRRFVKSFPANSHGFEIETELTVHALQMRLPAAEIDTAYGVRPEGSASKLNTFRDGWRILGMIGLLVRDERPLQFFSAAAGLAWTGSAVLGVPVVLEFFRIGAVPRYPSLIVAVGLAMIGIVAFACGVILDTVSRVRLEQRRLAYLAIPGTAELNAAEARRQAAGN